MQLAIVGGLGKRRIAALILAAVQLLDRALVEIPHAALCARRKLKRDVMPAISAARKRRLTIEQPVILEARPGYPGPLSCQTCDLFAVAKNKTLHVVRDRQHRGPQLCKK